MAEPTLKFVEDVKTERSNDGRTPMNRNPSKHNTQTESGKQIQKDKDGNFYVIERNLLSSSNIFSC